MAVTFPPPGLPNPLPLPAQDTWPEAKHYFDERTLWAIRSAIASGRPLLLRGEPGIGKSQVARAAAVAVKVPFLYHVVHERSERDDLLFSYDAVARLAAAQASSFHAQQGGDWEAKLVEKNFIRPGVLWWAFSWKEAAGQAQRYTDHCRECLLPAGARHDGTPRWDPTASEAPCGPVVLIDEIDKADPSVPNGLLESLGNRGFQTEQTGAVSLPPGAKPPLIVLTTNEERELPAAFLRRCLVLEMRFPEPEAAAEVLIEQRARACWDASVVSDAVCREVVKQLLAEREQARLGDRPEPGAAEFLDILRVLADLCPRSEAEQMVALQKVAGFALRKHRGAEA